MPAKVNPDVQNINSCWIMSAECRLSITMSHHIGDVFHRNIVDIISQWTEKNLDL